MKQKLKTKTALITGGAGFIGSHLVDLLLKKQWHITVVDDLSANNFEIPSWTNQKALYFWEDFASETILDMIKKQSFDYVFHLAAKPSIPWSIENPSLSHAVNVFKTIKLLEACKGNIIRFIFSSSSAIYGNISGNQGADEMFDEPSPHSPYALQKLEIENYLKIFQELFGFDYVALRYFNVYGPRQLGGSPYSNVISSWMHNIKNFLPCRLDGDGNQTRDFVFVEDVAEANYLAAITEISKKEERVYNIGFGKQTSCNQVLEILKNNNIKFKVVNSPSRTGDVRHIFAKVQKAKKSLLWIPTTNINDGIMKTIKWWKI